MQSPIMVAVKSIRELRRAAFQANRAGDLESESMLLRAADRQEAQVIGQASTPEEARTFRDIVEAGS